MEEEKGVLICVPFPIKKIRKRKTKGVILSEERDIMKVISTVETDILYAFYSAFPDINLSVFMAEVLYDYLLKLRPDKVKRLNLKPPELVEDFKTSNQPKGTERIRKKRDIEIARKVKRKKEIQRILDDAENERLENRE